MREGVFRHPGNVRIKEVEKTLCGSLVKNNLWNEVYFVHLKKMSLKAILFLWNKTHNMLRRVLLRP